MTSTAQRKCSHSLVDVPSLILILGTKRVVRDAGVPGAPSVPTYFTHTGLGQGRYPSTAISIEKQWEHREHWEQAYYQRLKCVPTIEAIVGTQQKSGNISGKQEGLDLFIGVAGLLGCRRVIAPNKGLGFSDPLTLPAKAL